MKHSEWYSTYSIIAIDPEAGEIGGAVQTHQMCVGAIIPSIEPGVGAVASQSIVNFSFPEAGLTMLKQGIEPERIVAALVASDEGERYRQVAVLNASGNGAIHSGSGCIPEFGHVVGRNYCIQANMMSRPTVVEAMKAAFENTDSNLGYRLLAALEAAQAEDGDIRGMESASLLVLPNTVNTPRWKALYDLRVDESENPVTELKRLVRLKKACNISEDGEKLWEENDFQGAVELWRRGCETAPELEELRFWPAVNLAGKKPLPDSLSLAAGFLRDGLTGHPRWTEWKDLLYRLEKCGILERQGAADELLEELDKADS